MPEFKANFKSVFPDFGGNLPGQLIFGIPGKDGGYYLIAADQVDENTIRFTFTPSQVDMPEVEPVEIDIPGATDEQIRKNLEEYLLENPIIVAPGKDGKDGVSATHSWDGTVLTITSASGTSSADLKGEKGDKGDPGGSGDPGEDGYSPSAKVERTELGARITITDKDGTTTAEVFDGEGGSGGGSTAAVLYVPQDLAPERQAQARTNIGATTIDEVKEALGIEDVVEFSETGELVELNLDLEEGTELNVISEIHRDSTWGESNKLVLHQVSGVNFVDLSSYIGGVGKVFEKNGLTATVNADCTLTVTGTNTSTGWTQVLNYADWHSDYSKRIYPAGTYRIPSGLTLNIRAAQYPADITISGASGNLQNKFTVTESFRVVGFYYAVAGGATVNKTMPLGLFRSDAIPETDYEYTGNIYTATFDSNVYEGEYNWTTGELKDVEGNTIAYYESQSITKLPGTNYFWTGFGKNTVSNTSADLEKVILRLDEPAPEDTVPSICDFMLTPTTPEAAYSLYYSAFLPNGKLYGSEVPIMTTKGILSVKDSDGNVKYSKYVEPMFNTRGVSDVLTHKGLAKKWSKKFYLTKEPVSVTYSPPPYSGPPDAYIFVWEFDESEFESTGIPAKMHDIPMASPCFINNDKSENNVNKQAIWHATPYPAFFSYDEASGKYTLTARGIEGWSIKKQLTEYSKVHFYYQLETPYVLPFTFAMGIDAGDQISFEADIAESQPYIETIPDFNGSVNPSVTAFVPRSIEDAMGGMNNVATMLNMDDNSTDGDATVQGYSWIGEGDGTTDYTTRIQQKIDEIHKITNGGTIYLGPGTYPISNCLIVYENTRIVGDGRTVIEQAADNTHAIVLSGSYITLRDLTIKLSGACTEDTACVFANASNHSEYGTRDERYPENMYVQYCTIQNVKLQGTYSLSRNSDGQYYISDEAKAYRGYGLRSRGGYFNFLVCENVTGLRLFSVIGSGSGSRFSVTVNECRHGVYPGVAYSIVEISGHSYYAYNDNGEVVNGSETLITTNTHDSLYLARAYDSQHFSTIAFFDSKSMANVYIPFTAVSDYTNAPSYHAVSKISHSDFIDLGRGNSTPGHYETWPFVVGNRLKELSGQTLINPSLQGGVDNALAGAGIWGNISSNVAWTEYGIRLMDVCRYPKENTVEKDNMHSIVSSVSPNENNPIELIIDISDRPVAGFPALWIQFDHRYVASELTISLDIHNTGEYTFSRSFTNNVDPMFYWMDHQIGANVLVYRIKVTFTKALIMPDFIATTSDHIEFSVDYNPDGLVGIVNIGMPQNEPFGRAFLGECGGSLYGNVDMHQNTFKNLADPVDDGDAVSKAYLEARLAALEALLSKM